MARVNIEADVERIAERKRLAEYALQQERIERHERAQALIALARERALKFIASRKAEVLKSDPHAFLERNGWRFMGTTVYEESKYKEAKWYANLEHLNTTATFNVAGAVEITLALWLCKRAGVTIAEFDRHFGITIPDVTTGY